MNASFIHISMCFSDMDSISYENKLMINFKTIIKVYKVCSSPSQFKSYLKTCIF